MLEAGVGKAEVAQSVSKQRIDAANKKFIDPATKKLNEAINEVTARATPSGGAGKLKASEYLGYIAEGNLAGQTVGGEIITQEKAKRLQAEATRKDKDPAYKGTEEFQAVEKELQTKDRYSVAREMQSMVGEDVQKVEVKNFDQIGKAVSQYLNENKQMVFNRNGG
jgi:hypothetical protein